jgi:hypothetical protein
MKKPTLIPAILLMVLAVSCKKVVTDPIPVNPVPEQKELVANPDNPDDAFGVYHNKGMDYIKAGYTLTGDYNFNSGHEMVVALLRKWAQEMAKDKEFLAYCKTDEAGAVKRMSRVLDSIILHPEAFHGGRIPITDRDINAVMCSQMNEAAAIKMGPYIDFSLDKLDSLINKRIDESAYYKGIKVIEKDYMAIASDPKGRRYMAIMRYSPSWTLQNYPNEEPAKFKRIIVADLVGAGKEWLDGGSTVDVVVAGIAASASAALNKGKY